MGGQGDVFGGCRGLYFWGTPPLIVLVPPPGSVDFDKDCEDPEYKPLAGTAKEVDDEVFGGALPPLNLPPQNLGGTTLISSPPPN